MIFWKLKRTLLKIQSSLFLMRVGLGGGGGGRGEKSSDKKKRGGCFQAIPVHNFSIFTSNFEI